MAERWVVHPVNPQGRLVAKAAACLSGGGVVVAPTDCTYVLAFALGHKAAQERVVRLRLLAKGHLFSLMCLDLSDIATYALLDNSNHRLLKRLTPGPFTFLLPATRAVPKRLQHPKRRTVGIRISAHPVMQALLHQLGEPLLVSTLQLPGQDAPIGDPDEVAQLLARQIDGLIDSGPLSAELTTVIDATEQSPKVIRAGRGAELV